MNQRVPPRASGREVPRWVGVVAVLGILGVGFYVSSWIVAGFVTPGYDPWRQAISETFAVGAPAATLVEVALLASGAGLVLMGPALHRGLPGRGILGPASATVSGVATVLVALHPCSAGCPGFGASPADSLHVVLAGVGYLTLILAPLACAWRVRAQDPRFARWSALLGGLALAGFSLRHLGGLDPLPGTQQRVFNTVADAWYVLAAVVLLRRSRTTPGPDGGHPAATPPPHDGQSRLPPARSRRDATER